MNTFKPSESILVGLREGQAALLSYLPAWREEGWRTTLGPMHSLTESRILFLAVLS